MNRTATNLARAVFLCAAGTAFVSPVIEAQTFTYTPRDLILSFRQTGNATDVAIDIGQASLYTTGAPVDLSSYYNPADLVSTFGVGLNNVSWSISGATVAGDGGSASVPTSTLWVTRGRDPATPDVQTAPWTSRSAFAQAPTAQRIVGIPTGAVAIGTSISSSYATVPDANAQSYHSYITDLGNYQNTFPGSAENNTITGSTRSDLYELRPASGNPAGTFLGTFELSSSGAMTFTAVPEPGTWAMIGLGGLMLVGVQRLRRRV